MNESYEASLVSRDTRSDHCVLLSAHRYRIGDVGCGEER